MYHCAVISSTFASHKNALVISRPTTHSMSVEAFSAEYLSLAAFMSQAARVSLEMTDREEALAVMILEQSRQLIFSLGLPSPPKSPLGITPLLGKGPLRDHLESHEEQCVLFEIPMPAPGEKRPLPQPTPHKECVHTWMCAGAMRRACVSPEKGIRSAMDPERCTDCWALENGRFQTADVGKCRQGSTVVCQIPGCRAEGRLYTVDVVLLSRIRVEDRVQQRAICGDHFRCCNDKGAGEHRMRTSGRFDHAQYCVTIDEGDLACSYTYCGICAPERLRATLSAQKRLTPEECVQCREEFTDQVIVYRDAQDDMSPDQLQLLDDYRKTTGSPGKRKARTAPLGSQPRPQKVARAESVRMRPSNWFERRMTLRAARADSDIEFLRCIDKEAIDIYASVFGLLHSESVIGCADVAQFLLFTSSGTVLSDAIVRATPGLVNASTIGEWRKSITEATATIDDIPDVAETIAQTLIENGYADRKPLVARGARRFCALFGKQVADSRTFAEFTEGGR